MFWDIFLLTCVISKFDLNFVFIVIIWMIFKLSTFSNDVSLYLLIFFFNCTNGNQCWITILCYEVGIKKIRVTKSKTTFTCCYFSLTHSTKRPFLYYVIRKSRISLVIHWSTKLFFFQRFAPEYHLVVQVSAWHRSLSYSA